MDPVKEAFQKIKEDISLLKGQLTSLQNQLLALQTPTIPTQNSSMDTSFSNNPAQNPTVPQEIRGLKPSDYNVSTGNKGVPTDKPTYQPTVQQTDKIGNLNDFSSDFEQEDDLFKAKEALESLDNIKKALRTKFKRLTPQEMLVFSTIFNLENMQIDEISYKVVANNLNLSESSIRDYVNKLISKGIPIRKKRLNNKIIVLSISEDLKRITTLPTLLRLREL
jgi:hypothetical protein